MAEPLKTLLGAEAVRALASQISKVEPAFDARLFVTRALDGLDALELKARSRHVANAMFEALPPDPLVALAALERSLGPPIEASNEPGLSVLRYMPHADFVAAHGLGCFEASMRFQHALTQRFTAEFSIREFLRHHPDRTLAVLRQWASDPSEHVRRLVSEGTRPRLPWASQLEAFRLDPRPVLELLELLKDDPSLYVRRSVANNLNDVTKDHPELALEIAKRWWRGAPSERKYVVRHALRGLVKQGHPKALGLLGFGKGPEVSVTSFVVTPESPRIGESVSFSFELESKSKQGQKLLVDYVFRFASKSGAVRSKVFKLKELELAPNAAVTLRSRISLEQHTTRKHYPGPHQVELLINGRAFPGGSFEVVEEAKRGKRTRPKGGSRR
ncbi:MAG: DNA alkylation repair protein [Deltaproteobacteria bacterium]|nr:DNA alkylation repair protein [Deltaproteobacteria bacterium]